MAFPSLMAFARQTRAGKMPTTDDRDTPFTVKIFSVPFSFSGGWLLSVKEVVNKQYKNEAVAS